MDTKKEDILGYYADGDLYCPICFSEENFEEADFLTKDNADEEKVYTCDKCKKIIKN